MMPSQQAKDYNEQGRRYLDQSNFEKAKALFESSLQLAPDWSAPAYNLGLASKHQGDWKTSLAANWTAHLLDPEDEATYWNLSIASCAVGDWDKAEVAFKAIGLALPEGPPPWDFQLGSVPIRLNSETGGEVVWCDRLDPSRARIVNIPLPDSGFRYGDILLTDGEPVGYRRLGERDVPVFNALEILEKSSYRTHDFYLEASSENALDNAFAVLEERGIRVEDWTSNIRTLCRACSEGRPHDTHDHDLAAEDWQNRRHVGIALLDSEDPTKIVAQISRIAAG